MSTAPAISDLRDAVKETLERKGVLQQLQASIRSQVFSALLAAEDAPRPEPCDETLLINELIREHLVYNGYQDTLSVFLAESGQPQLRPFDRDFLARRLRVHETPTTQQVPLLYQLVAQQQQTVPQSQQPATKPQLLAAQPLPLQQQQQTRVLGSQLALPKQQHQQQKGQPAGDLLSPCDSFID